MTCTLPRQGLYAPNSPPPPSTPDFTQSSHTGTIALSGTVSCTNRAYARDTSRGLRVLCTSPAYARDRLVRNRRLQNSGFYTRQACAQVRLMHATLRYVHREIQIFLVCDLFLILSGGPGVYRLECKDGAAIKDLFDRVANNKRLPDPPHHRSSRTQSLDSVLDTDSSKPAARTPLSASYGDHSQLYTLPPSMGPPTTPDRQSSTSRFPTAHSQGRDHRSSTSPNCERPPIATPPPPLPAKPTPEADYENLGSSPNYDYILAASPRPIDDGVSIICFCFYWNGTGGGKGG